MAKDKSYLIGLDLGQSADFTALAVLERKEGTPPPPPPVPSFQIGPVRPRVLRQIVVRPTIYRLVHLERFPLGLPYPRIIAAVAHLLERPLRKGHFEKPLHGCTLVVDRTGCGAPVCDSFAEANLPCILRPVTITGGQNDSYVDGYHRVAKLSLVSVLRVLLGNDRLQADMSLPFVKELGSELQTFTSKISASGHESFESWREKDKDDLVLAIAIAAWMGERAMPEVSRTKPQVTRGMGDLRTAPDGTELQSPIWPG